MKIKNIITLSPHLTLKNFLGFTIILSFGVMSFPLTIFAQNENSQTNLEKNISTSQQEQTIKPLSESQLKEIKTQKIDEQTKKTYNSYIISTENNTLNSSMPKDYLLQDSITITEDGSNLMIVRGSSRCNSFNTSINTNSSYNSSNSNFENETQQNSSNVNNGLYMNITNPDGSSMNFGAYFNSSTNSNQPRRKSSAQILVDN